MNAKDKYRLEAFLKKYAAYISNLSYHLEKNNPQGNEKEIVEQRLKDFSEMYNDLRKFLQCSTISPALS